MFDDSKHELSDVIEPPGKNSHGSKSAGGEQAQHYDKELDESLELTNEILSWLYEQALSLQVLINCEMHDFDD